MFAFVGFRIRAGRVHPAVHVVGRRVDRVEVHGRIGRVDYIVRGPGRHHYGKPGADFVFHSVEHAFSVAGFNPQKLFKFVCLEANIFAWLKAHDH